MLKGLVCAITGLGLYYLIDGIILPFYAKNYAKIYKSHSVYKIKGNKSVIVIDIMNYEFRRMNEAIIHQCAKHVNYEQYYRVYFRDCISDRLFYLDEYQENALVYMGKYSEVRNQIW